MATVRKRRWEYPKGSGEWKEAWVLTYTDRAGKRHSGGQFERKKDAEVTKRRIEDEIGRGIHTPSRDTVTFEYASERFLRDAERRWKAKDLAGNTFMSYCNQVKHVQSFWGTVKLTEITSSTIKQWVDDLATQKATRTVTRRLEGRSKEGSRGRRVEPFTVDLEPRGRPLSLGLSTLRPPPPGHHHRSPERGWGQLLQGHEGILL